MMCRTFAVKGSPTQETTADIEEQFTGLRAESQGSDFAEKEDSLRVLAVSDLTRETTAWGPGNFL